MPVEAALQRAIDALESRLDELRPVIDEGRRLMRAINAIFAAAGEPERYADVGGGVVAHQTRQYHRTAFFGKPLAHVVKQLLDDHHAGLTVDELYELMSSGGFEFKKANAEDAKNGLKISLGKYTQFDRTPQGVYVNSSKPKRRTNGVQPGSESTAGEIAETSPESSG